MTTQDKGIPFADAISAKPLRFSDEELFKGTDSFRSYPLLVDYDPLQDPDFHVLKEQVLTPALETLKIYDLKCRELKDTDKLRYEFEPHSNTIAIATTGYLYDRGCSPKTAGLVGLALRYHDIGKTELPHEIWHLEDKDEAKAAVPTRRTHCEKGADKIRTEWLPLVPAGNEPLCQFVEFMADIAQYHHAEARDVSWCDKRLDELPLAIRVAAVIEGFDGANLERNPNLDAKRTLEYTLEKMSANGKSVVYDQILVMDFVQYMSVHDNDFISEVATFIRGMPPKKNPSRRLAPA